MDLLESERHGRIAAYVVVVSLDLLSSAVAGVGRPARGTLPLKSVIAVIVGNWLEFYDFLVFTFFAVMIGEAASACSSPRVCCSSWLYIPRT